MTTIPARLARTARPSGSPEIARKRVIQLYRDWYRSAPEVISLYTLNISPVYFRHQIRAKFEANRHISDLQTIDVLLLKSRQEYQETMNCWKQNDHILGVLLSPVQGRPKRSFLERFYEGRDEDQVLPAATGVVYPSIP